MRNRAALFVLLASSLLTTAVPAAEPAAPTPRESAARELYLAMGGLKTAEAAEDMMMNAVHANPQLLPYEDVFRAWYRATMAKAGLEPKIVALYAGTFTEAELKDLTAFYRSPLGQKALSKVPELMKRGIEIGEQAAKENQPELERMLEARRKELETANQAKTPAPTPTPAPTATPGQASPEILRGSSASFAGAAEGARLLSVEDGFVRAMSPFDRSGRLEVNRDVSVREYLAFAGRQVVDWTAQERTRMSEILSDFRRLAAGLDLRLPAQVVFVKTTGREEGAAAYCRGPVVIFPARIVATAADKLRPIVFHELFHVARTHDPGRRRELYRIVGFDVCPEIVLPEPLRRRKITNPDAPHLDSFIRVRAGGPAGPLTPVTPILFASADHWDPKKGGAFFRQMNFSLLVLEDAGEGRFRPALDAAGEPRLLDPSSTPDYFEQIGRNTDYVIHPEEILADNFVLLLIPPNGTPAPTPRILEELRAVLKPR